VHILEMLPAEHVLWLSSIGILVLVYLEVLAPMCFVVHISLANGKCTIHKRTSCGCKQRKPLLTKIDKDVDQIIQD
jgi:hypothetical protein